MEIIDSHTHWGPSLTMGTEVTTGELLTQAEFLNGMPFSSKELGDPLIAHRMKLVKDSSTWAIPSLWDTKRILDGFSGSHSVFF
jgi:hypothetical protein